MGHETCSTKGLELFQQYPLFEAIREQRAYMGQCGEMAKIFNIAVGNEAGIAAQLIQEQFGKSAEDASMLVSQAKAYDEDKKTKNRKKDSSSGTNCAAFPCDIGPAACVATNIRDGNPFDCDIGPCDCSL